MSTTFLIFIDVRIIKKLDFLRLDKNNLTERCKKCLSLKNRRWSFVIIAKISLNKMYTQNYTLGIIVSPLPSTRHHPLFFWRFIPSPPIGMFNIRLVLLTRPSVQIK